MEFELLSTAAAGMRAQRAMLDVAARNVAAAQASTPGHPYTRLVARLAGSETATSGDGFPEPEPGLDPAASDAPALEIRSAAGETADAITEMIAVLDAQRAYEADASMFDIGKRLAERTLDIGRG